MASAIRKSGVKQIPLSEIKDNLSRYLREAESQEIIITRHGKRQAVVVSYEEWERLSHVPTFGRLLMAAPLSPDDLPARDRSPIRQTDF